jgi:hypothetical protein
MGLSEWKCELDLLISQALNMVHLDFQDFINPKQAQECKVVGCCKQPTSSATTPSMRVLVLAIEPNRLGFMVLRPTIEVIHFLEDVLAMGRRL